MKDGNDGAYRRSARRVRHPIEFLGPNARHQVSAVRAEFAPVCEEVDAWRGRQLGGDGPGSVGVERGVDCEELESLAGNLAVEDESFLYSVGEPVPSHEEWSAAHRPRPPQRQPAV